MHTHCPGVQRSEECSEVASLLPACGSQGWNASGQPLPAESSGGSPCSSQSCRSPDAKGWRWVYATVALTWIDGHPRGYSALAKVKDQAEPMWSGYIHTDLCCFSFVLKTAPHLRTGLCDWQSAGGGVESIESQCTAVAEMSMSDIRSNPSPAPDKLVVPRLRKFWGLLSWL